MFDNDPNQVRDDVPFPNPNGARNPNLPMGRGPAVGHDQTATMLQQAAQILGNAGYDITPKQQPMQPAYEQDEDYQDKPSVAPSDARMRLGLLQVGFQHGLADSCGFMLDVIADYRQKFYAGTGQQLSDSEALSHIVAALNAVTD